MITQLWPHQLEALDLIERQAGAMVAHEMGCGKTLGVIAYIDKHRPEHVLILCPRAVVGVWPREFDKHLGPGHGITVVPLLNGAIADRVEQARANWSAAACVVYVVNYEAAWREPMGAAFLRPTWDMVVLDESHRTKSPSGRQSRWCGRLGLRAKKRVCLTGTPMPHSPLDVWAQYRFLAPSIYPPTWTQFKNRYATLGGYRVNGRPVQVVGYQNIDELHNKFYGVAHRVKKDDVLTLPEFIHQEIVFDLPPAAQRAYDAMQDEFIAEIEGGVITASNALVKLLRLQQIAGGQATTEDGGVVVVHNAKAEALADYLKDVDAAEPVAVFCRFTADLDAVHQAAESLGRGSAELSGRRNDVGSLWRPAPGTVAAIQIQAGGVGIDLTAARYAIYYSQTCSLGDYDQSLARLHRPGQHRPVVYAHLLAAGTVDEKIRRALAARKNIVESVLSLLTSVSV